MNKLEQQLKEAEALVKSVRKELLAQRKEEEQVKLVFPKGGYYLVSYGGVCHGSHVDHTTQGNSFYTHKEAVAESLRREAEVRVREAINIANKGDNGFKYDKKNCELYIENRCGEMDWAIYTTCQSNDSWGYIRTTEATQKLLDNPTFVADWKLMKGITC